MNKSKLLDYCDKRQISLTEEKIQTQNSFAQYLISGRIKEIELLRKFIVNG